MVAFTSTSQFQRKQETVPAPELGDDVEIVVSEITALDAWHFRQFTMSVQQSNGADQTEIGLRGVARLLEVAIIDPETGKKAFAAGELETVITDANSPAFMRAFHAALRLNGFDVQDEGSTEGNSEAIPSEGLPIGSP